MGTLKKMVGFLNDSANTLSSVENKLNDLQEYFNQNFNNVNAIRNDEIEFLQKEFFNNPDSFPKEIVKTYKNELKKQDELFVQNYNELKEKRDKQKETFEEKEKERVNYHKRLKTNNTGLDNREEKLKSRVLELEEEIAEYNRQIDELNTGFGFIANFFTMKKIEGKKKDLLSKRDDLVSDIEEVREKWKSYSEKHGAEEPDMKEAWTNAQVDYSMATEKLKNLKENRETIVKKAAFVTALSDLKGTESFLSGTAEGKKPASCERCKSDNRENYFFCRYCGERFSKDRKDIMGSLVEVGELNEVYNSILEGIKETVAFLALIKGIHKATAEFTKSVQSVKNSQDQYASLPTLKIDIPEFSQNFAEDFKKLNEDLKYEIKNLHPVEFAEQYKKYTDSILTDKNIEQFFLAMGDELDKTTKEQW